MLKTISIFGLSILFSLPLYQAHQVEVKPHPEITKIFKAETSVKPVPNFDVEVRNPLIIKQQEAAEKAREEAEKQRIAAEEAEKERQAQLAAEQAKTAQAQAVASQQAAVANAGDAKAFIYQKESGNYPGAINKSSGACGLGQALPCSKLPCSLTDYACQDVWFTNYMKQRYGSWENAKAFWLSHSWW